MFVTIIHQASRNNIELYKVVLTVVAAGHVLEI